MILSVVIVKISLSEYVLYFLIVQWLSGIYES